MPRLLYVDPFCGDSRAEIAQGLARHARRWQVTAVTLPPGGWRERFRWGAYELWLALRPRLEAGERFDAICVCSLVRAAELLHLMAGSHPPVPVVLYHHEHQSPANQALPARDPEALRHFSAEVLAAIGVARVFFNSRLQRDQMLAAAGELGLHERDRAALAARSRVVYPGIDVGPAPTRRLPADGETWTILWNHRWMREKGPGDLFRATRQLLDRGLPLRLIVTGEHSTPWPPTFAEFARGPAQSALVHMGYIADREHYLALVSQADVVLSTARHENFGLSILEAAARGCVPLLPQRLVYPELIPAADHPLLYYRSPRELTGRLTLWLSGRLDRTALQQQRESATARARSFDWSVRINAWEAALDELVAGETTTQVED